MKILSGVLFLVLLSSNAYSDWVDVSIDKTCPPESWKPSCITMEDTQTGLQWTNHIVMAPRVNYRNVFGTSQWVPVKEGSADDVCKKLKYNGIAGGWRLPTTAEVLQAGKHGIAEHAQVQGWLNYFFYVVTVQDAWGPGQKPEYCTHRSFGGGWETNWCNTPRLVVCVRERAN